MLTEVLIDKTLQVPFMMTNMYPFLMGQAALKHEHIPEFPQVAGNPADHILMAHCGYLGVVPQSFSTEWALRDKVLAIVDDNPPPSTRAWRKARLPWSSSCLRSIAGASSRAS